jgi:hypothetical protein
MLRGDFEAAWRVCDIVQARRKEAGETCSHWPRHEQFIWDGTPLQDRRVLVRCYHGLGDTIQFVRLLPLLRAQADHVTLWVQPQLMSLLEGIAGADRLLALHDGAPDVEYDIDIELMELPHALRLRLADIPSRVPYLRVPRPARAVDNDAIAIGLVTRSGSWQPERTIPPELFASWRELPSIHWYSLDFPVSSTPFAMPSLACEDIRLMASRMRSLDLVITVDTMQAHLAGALGIPTWLLLPANADWRWMNDRKDSPWYPKMRLFRCDASGWRGVLDEVRGDLIVNG